MKDEYDIYYLSPVSFEMLKDIPFENSGGLKDKYKNLMIHWAADEKEVKVSTCKMNNDEPVRPLTPETVIGCLSKDDGQKYEPYLKKGHADLYEVCFVSFDAQGSDLYHMARIAVRIKENPTRMSVKKKA